MLALAIGVAGISFLFALRRGSAREAKASPPIAVDVPAPPQRLPAAPEFARYATPAAVERPAPVTDEVSIRLRGLAPEARTAEMGVATFDSVTGAGFSWTPLDVEAGSSGDIVLRAAVHDTCEQSVVLASQPSFARHGYLARGRFTPTRAGAANVEFVLDAVVTPTRFQLPDGADRAGPLRLVRVDDPQWLPMEHGTTGLLLTRNESVTLLLGAGTYELQDPIARDEKQRFDVPAKAPIVISPTLTVAEADRP